MEAATSKMAAFVQRRPDRPEAVEAGRTWEAAVVAGTLVRDDDKSHQRCLNTILSKRRRW
ncbi:hypothetical protein ACFYZJ_27710 [Streptomyces sp. NPDC001848]|uniref:hypothetical protein n=1 Tax=Streptomyces sp. NPDC001848 TaxID=3364618 RepID=UPI00368365E8